MSQKEQEIDIRAWIIRILNAGFFHKKSVISSIIFPVKN